MPHAISMALLMLAIGHVENPKQDPNLVGLRGEVGIYQIRQCVVDDVNKHYHTKIKLSDCKKEGVAAAVLQLYLTYWGKHYAKATGHEPTVAVLARIWNGGPDGWMEHCTISYAKLVTIAYAIHLHNLPPTV